MGILKVAAKFRSFGRLNNLSKNNFSLSAKSFPALGFDPIDKSQILREGQLLLEVSHDCWELWDLILTPNYLYFSHKDQSLNDQIPLVGILSLH